MIRAYWYDSQDNSLSYSDLRAQDTVGGGWTLYSNDFSVPLDAAKFKIGLGSELQSGWIAFDDLRIQYQVPSTLSTQPLAVPGDGGGGGPSWETLYSSGFESGDSILRQAQDRPGAAPRPAPFPPPRSGTGSFGRLRTGLGHRRAPQRQPRRGGQHACGDAYSVIQTDYLDVQPSSTYHLSAWLRGELVLRYALDAAQTPRKAPATGSCAPATTTPTRAR